MTQAISNPFAPFLDRRGRPLTGSLYIGVSGDDPQTDPVATYFDAALTIAAPQPIAVIGGFPTRGGNPAQVFVGVAQYSLRARDADGAEVFYLAAAAPAPDQYQPLDSDLTAIAALATTAYGRAVLALADAAALRTHAGIVPSLPLAGGTMTGAIIRSGQGAHPYMVGSGYAQARIFVTANGAADPRTTTGDIWLEEAP